MLLSPTFSFLGVLAHRMFCRSFLRDSSTGAVRVSTVLATGSSKVWRQRTACCFPRRLAARSVHRFAPNIFGAASDAAQQWLNLRKLLGADVTGILFSLEHRLIVANGRETVNTF